jgi:hypothetical protein
LIPLPTRRSMLASSAAVLAATALPGRSHAATPYDLAPDWRTNWRLHRIDPAGTIGQLANGVSIVIPATTDPAAADRTQLALWAAAAESGNFEVRFDYRVTARSTVTGGSFATFYYDALGSGTTQFPKAVPNWKLSTQPPGDPLYMPNARGLRFSFATFNPAAADVDQRLRLRYFKFQQPPGTLIGLASAKVFPFTTGVPYNVFVRRRLSKLQIAVRDLNTGISNSYLLTDSRINVFGGGYVGFRWRGQSAELTNFSLVRIA